MGKSSSLTENISGPDCFPHPPVSHTWLSEEAVSPPCCWWMTPLVKKEAESMAGAQAGHCISSTPYGRPCGSKIVGFPSKAPDTEGHIEDVGELYQRLHKVVALHLFFFVTL